MLVNIFIHQSDADVYAWDVSRLKSLYCFLREEEYTVHQQYRHFVFRVLELQELLNEFNTLEIQVPYLFVVASPSTPFNNESNG